MIFAKRRLALVLTPNAVAFVGACRLRVRTLATTYPTPRAIVTVSTLFLSRDGRLRASPSHVTSDPTNRSRYLYITPDLSTPATCATARIILVVYARLTTYGPHALMGYTHIS